MNKATSTALEALRAAANLPQEDSRTPLSLVLFGAYNTGKSTLIKRLLVERGEQVPDWLTIAGGPETNIVASVPLSEDIVLVDTPGIQAGMSLHEGEAAVALQDADALLVLVLPSLLTSDRDEVVAVLRGEHVHPDGWPWPEGAVQVAITQLDQGGIDPSIDPDGFSGFAQRKVEDLTGVLERFNAPAPSAVHVVVADAFADVGNDGEVDRSSYERGDWDGIDRLLAGLESMDHELIRDAAVVRRLVARAELEADATRLAAETLKLEGDALGLRAAERKDQVASLERQIDEAVGDLELRLDQFAATIYADDVGEDVEALGKRQSEVITDWVADQRAAFGTDELEDAEVHSDTPSGRRRGTPTDTAWAVMDALFERKDAIGANAKALTEQVLGGSLDEIGEELKRARRDAESYFEEGNRLFKSKADVARADRVLKAAAAIPVLIELGGVLKSLRDDPTPAHERETQDLRARVRDANRDASEQARELLSDALSGRRAAFEEEIEVASRECVKAEAGSVRLSTRAAEIERCIAELRQLVAAQP